MSQLLTPLGSNALLEEVRQSWNNIEHWRIPGFESATLEQKWNLLTRLTFDPRSWERLPNPDALAAYILNESPSETQFLERFQMMAEPTAGPQVVAWLEQQTNLGPAGVDILWRVKGLAALPHLARFKSQLRGSMIGYYREQLDEIREQAGISKSAWNLLLLAPSTKATKTAASTLDEIACQGATLPTAEWRLLAAHEVCGPLLVSLTFVNAGTLETFKAPHWPPFGDIAIAPAAAQKFNPIGLSVEPNDLFLHLEDHGWIRGRASREDGRIRSHTKTFPDLNVSAELAYEPGVPTRFGGGWQKQTIRQLSFIPIDHPIARATVLGDLADLLGHSE